MQVSHEVLGSQNTVALEAFGPRGCLGCFYTCRIARVLGADEQGSSVKPGCTLGSRGRSFEMSSFWGSGWKWCLLACGFLMIASCTCQPGLRMLYEAAQAIKIHVRKVARQRQMWPDPFLHDVIEVDTRDVASSPQKTVSRATVLKKTKELRPSLVRTLNLPEGAWTMRLSSCGQGRASWRPLPLGSTVQFVLQSPQLPHTIAQRPGPPGTG